tara:strand:+ start:18726 stop:19040 length:315 start_codon:yes stop_codon:yes gene_type:complete
MIKGKSLPTTEYILPLQYNKIPFLEKRLVREQYIKEQKGLCMYCNGDLDIEPPKAILDKKIDWNKFPRNFRESNIHLQHCHKTGMTEGAVHMYCNAVLFIYENR